MTVIIVIIFTIYLLYLTYDNHMLEEKIKSLRVKINEIDQMQRNQNVSIIINIRRLYFHYSTRNHIFKIHFIFSFSYCLKYTKLYWIKPQ